MDTAKYIAKPNEAGRDRNESQANPGRILERYHYRAPMIPDAASTQKNDRALLLENVPALLQALSFH